MKALFSWPLIVFIGGLLISAVLFDAVKIEHGTVDYFQKHGYFFLIFITLFPRLTLLFSSVPFGGILWWLGFFFYPRILVAILATIAYLHTNPILVYISWVVAISGEVLEKKGLKANKRFVVRHYSSGSPLHRTPRDLNDELPQKSGNVFEAEFTKKEEP